MEISKSTAVNMRYALENTDLSPLQKTQRRVNDILNELWDNWYEEQKELYKEFQEIETLVKGKINQIIEEQWNQQWTTMKS